ncbi:hypothetical protein DFH06DRAFT_1142887 [Mycena polygramma]|nr:hypothetical protein DFH06DRAFT_1142887 [Mycena polygramma]
MHTVRITTLGTTVRVLVRVLFVVDTIHSAVCLHNRTAFRLSVTRTMALEAACRTRVLKVTKNTLLVWALHFVSALSLVFGIQGALSHQGSKFLPFVVLWLRFQTLSHFAITGFGKTDAIINQFIQALVLVPIRALSSAGMVGNRHGHAGPVASPTSGRVTVTEAAVAKERAVTLKKKSKNSKKCIFSIDWSPNLATVTVTLEVVVLPPAAGPVMVGGRLPTYRDIQYL